VCLPVAYEHFYYAFVARLVQCPAGPLEPAQALEVRRVGRAAVTVGNRMVHIAGRGGFVTAGEPTGQIAEAHEVRQCPRRDVPALRGRVAGMDQRA
jgi:hypothetical protein